MSCNILDCRCDQFKQCMTIENMLYTLHATYIKHDFYADFFLRFKRLLREFSHDRFTVQDEQNLSLLRFQQSTS